MKLFRRVSKKLDNWDGYGIKRMRILLVVLVGMLIIKSLNSGLPEPQIVQCNANCDLFYGSQYEHPRVGTGRLESGETVEILAHWGAKYDCLPTYWVQTKDGERGEVPQFCIDSEFLSLNDIDALNVEANDIVKITPSSSAADKFIVTNDKGNSITVEVADLEDFCSVRVNESLSSYELTDMQTYMSRARFERNFMGKEMDSSYANYIRKYGNDSTVVRYGIYLLSKSEDCKGFFNPVVCYDSNGIAQSYTLPNEVVSNGDGKILARMPLSEYIVDCLGWIVDNKYGFSFQMAASFAEDSSTFVFVSVAILAIFLMVFQVVWYFMMNHIFLALVFTLLPLKVPLKFLSNKVLFVILTLLLLVMTYAWTLIMIADGFLWWFYVPVVLFITYRMYKRFYKSLIRKPVFRCDKCKEIGTKYLESREFLNNRIEVLELETIEGSTTGSREAAAIITDSRGFRRSGTKRVSTKTTKYNTVEYTINIDVFDATYICSACQNSESVIEEDRTLISETELGSRSETRDT